MFNEYVAVKFTVPCLPEAFAQLYLQKTGVVGDGISYQMTFDSIPLREPGSALDKPYKEYVLSKTAGGLTLQLQIPAVSFYELPDLEEPNDHGLYLVWDKDEDEPCILSFLNGVYSHYCIIDNDVYNFHKVG